MQAVHLEIGIPLGLPFGVPQGPVAIDFPAFLLALAVAAVVVMQVVLMRVKVIRRVPRAMVALKARKPITTAGLFETAD